MSRMRSAGRASSTARGKFKNARPSSQKLTHPSRHKRQEQQHQHRRAHVRPSSWPPPPLPPSSQQQVAGQGRRHPPAARPPALPCCSQPGQDTQRRHGQPEQRCPAQQQPGDQGRPPSGHHRPAAAKAAPHARPQPWGPTVREGGSREGRQGRRTACSRVPPSLPGGQQSRDPGQLGHSQQPHTVHQHTQALHPPHTSPAPASGTSRRGQEREEGGSSGL